jgi:multicomponent K+:H+ antiporter subunit E
VKRLVPFPLLTVLLFAMWVLLTGFSPGHILLGAVVALVVSRVMLMLRWQRPRMRFGVAMIRLTGLVIADIVQSNIAVGRIVLFRPEAQRAGFIRYPTELRSPHALAVLAIIITATPGTLWVQHDAQRHEVLIHVLDLVDESQWIAFLRERYERLLLEIFP